MTTSEYVLNIALLAYILLANVGTRALTWRRMALPIVAVVVAGYAFLRDMPTVGNDVRLELAGLTAGAVLGVVAALLVRVRRTTDGLVMTAGIGFAALWVVVIVGRMLFAYGADHWFGRQIGQFSMTHQITGAGAWTAAFILMALAMVVTRVAATGVVTAVAARRPAPALA